MLYRLVKMLGLLSIFSNAFSDTQCPVVNNPGEDRRNNKNSLKIMQYNVEWLFLDYYKQADCPGDGCTWKNETQSNTHVKYVTNVINLYQPDIINFCEIEGCDELKSVINLTSNIYNPYLIKGTDTSTGQNVGMLTKINPISNLTRTDNTYNYPIENSLCNYNETGHVGVSKHYITTFKWHDLKIAYFAVHLLAYPLQPDRCAKREAQAKIMEQEIIKKVQEGYEILFIGDFNDYDRDILDLNNDKPISKVLDIIKGYDNSIYKLTNIAYKIPKEQRYTNWWDKNDDCKSTMDEFVMIDHILMSDQLLQKINNVEIYHGYPENCDRLNSDHYPVIVDLQI
jgi:exonuclease III